MTKCCIWKNTSVRSHQSNCLKIDPGQVSNRPRYIFDSETRVVTAVCPRLSCAVVNMTRSTWASDVNLSSSSLSGRSQSFVVPIDVVRLFVHRFHAAVVFLGFRRHNIYRGSFSRNDQFFYSGKRKNEGWASKRAGIPPFDNLDLFHDASMWARGSSAGSPSYIKKRQIRIGLKKQKTWR